uniref:Uncharacterized protein n=1 Tax=Anguilla anguilla TaxID=7936 RepID=A0A0E9Q7M5_ANGAN
MVTVIPASSSAMRKKAFFTGTLITPQPPWTVRDYEDKEQGMIREPGWKCSQETGESQYSC